MRTLLAAAAFIAAAACHSAAETQDAPVRTGAPNAEGQFPAFAGQTRAPERRSDLRLNVETIASGLDAPWAIAFLPDGSALVTERPGRMRRITRAGEVSAPIEGLPAVLAEAQGGLLDIALGASFASDRMVYWSYSEPRGEGASGTSVARARLSEDFARLADVEVIFRQAPAWRSAMHFGSRLVWDREGRLFVTLGERLFPDARVRAQDLSAHLGKVVRVGADGSVPPDNPFVSREGARGEIWSYGHRNIQAAALHPDTGALWTIEHGPLGGDEVNAPKPGRNYGWPIITYGEDYDGSPIGEGVTAREGMEQPIYYWDPVIAPSGALFYAGDLFPWRGDLLIGALRGAIVRLELDGERVTGEERVLTNVGRVRDIAEAADGALWVVTDESDGRLLRVTPR